MKTSFWHKNLLLVVALCVIVSLCTLVYFREVIIRDQGDKIEQLESKNKKISVQRDSLKKDIERLQLIYNQLILTNDSLKKRLEAFQRQLAELKVKHRKELDSLMAVPDDSIYILLQPVYPNYDNGILKYPFSGIQVRQIYSDALSYDMLSTEFGVQSKALSTSLLLNKNYETTVSNLNSQVSNLRNDISLCDSQIRNYNAEAGIMKKQVSRARFWRDLFAGTTIITAVVAVLR